MTWLTDQWRALPPRVRQYLVPIGLGGFVVGGVLMTGSDGEKTAIRRAPKEEVIESVLTERDTRSVTIDSIAGSLDNLKGQMQKLQREVGYLQGTRMNSPEAIEEQFRVLRDENAELKANLQSLRQTWTEALQKAQATQYESTARPAETPPGQGPTLTERAVVTPVNAAAEDHGPASERRKHWLERALAERDVRVTGQVLAPEKPALRNQVTSADKGRDTASPPPERKLQVFTASDGEGGKDASDTDAAGEEVWPYLPATSIISGVVITGLDAPTGQTAQENPFPALIRIKKDAILPNRFRASIEDCHALVSGYGSLAEERVYLRGETVACVATDGRVFESPLNAYLIGEDGKAGIRGRLVHRAGSAVSKAMMAAFWEAVGQAFDVKPVPILQTSGSQQYTDSFSPQSARSAAVAGAGAALEKLSEYYLELAEQQHPILEVDAGRGVDLVMTRGFRLEFKEITDPKLGSGPVSASAAAERAAGQANGVADAMLSLAGPAAARGRR